MILPLNIKKHLNNKEYFENKIGLSGAKVYIYDDLVLKIQTDLKNSYNEYQVINWLNKRIPTPQILAYEIDSQVSYTLMTKIEGKILCDNEYLSNPSLLIDLLVKALQKLWSVDCDDCPIDQSLDKRLKIARYNVENNLVDLENVEEDTFSDTGFQNSLELITWLENNRPKEELVFSHGDLSLPNIIVNGQEIESFIDLGKMGKADKWQDLAICYRSLKHNFEGRYNGGKKYDGYYPEMLFDKLNIKLDKNKLKYYLLLDELF